MRPPLEADQPTYEIVGPVERYDQRDHPNARSYLKPGTPEYDEYYSRHPELKDWDDENRRLAANARQMNQERDPVNEMVGLSVHYAQNLLSLESFVEGGYETLRQSIRRGGEIKKIDVDSLEMSAKVKSFAEYLGAAKVRVAKLKQEWVCSHYAAPYMAEPYGKEVVLDYPNIICMAVRQDPEMIRNGTGVAEHVEVHWKYSFSSLLSITMARFIHLLGYRARALPTNNSPYLVVPAFVDAGIGEQGRCSFVVTKEFGNNFRPAAVMTDMPLAIDRPAGFGLQDFCEKCLACAESCPSGAITRGGKEVIRGVRRWPLDGDKCRRFWDQRGRDCGICQAVCPWSHPNGLIHDAIRELNQSFPVLRSLFIAGEKLVYGKYHPTPLPAWLRRRGIGSAR